MEKKILLAVALLLALPLFMSAQMAFRTGTNAVNAGVGFAGLKWKGVSYGASFEHGITNNWGAGPHLAYSEYSKDGYKYHALLIGAKGAYHFPASDKADPYVGAEVGYIALSHTGSNESVAPHSYSSLGLGFYGGLRYYVSPAFGVYGELRLSTFAIVGIGICCKL